VIEWVVANGCFVLILVLNALVVGLFTAALIGVVRDRMRANPTGSPFMRWKRCEQCALLYLPDQADTGRCSRCS
jgi:hypothetical protein